MTDITELEQELKEANERAATRASGLALSPYQSETKPALIARIYDLEAEIERLRRRERSRDQTARDMRDDRDSAVKKLDHALQKTARLIEDVQQRDLDISFLQGIRAHTLEAAGKLEPQDRHGQSANFQLDLLNRRPESVR